MPRVNFQVDKATHARLAKVPWGYRAGVFRSFLRRFAAVYEQEGPRVLGLMLEGDYDIVPRYPEPTRNGSKSRRATT